MKTLLIIIILFTRIPGVYAGMDFSGLSSSPLNQNTTNFWVDIPDTFKNEKEAREFGHRFRKNEKAFHQLTAKIKRLITLTERKQADFRKIDKSKPNWYKKLNEIEVESSLMLEQLRFFVAALEEIDHNYFKGSSPIEDVGSYFFSTSYPINND